MGCWSEGFMLGTVRCTMQARVARFQNVRSVVQRWGKSKKGTFTTMWVTSREEQRLKITSLKCFPSSRGKQRPFDEPRSPTDTEQRPHACHGASPNMSINSWNKQSLCICWLEAVAWLSEVNDLSPETL